MFIMKLISQHVSGIIMPIIRRTRPCITAYGVLHCVLAVVVWRWVVSCVHCVKVTVRTVTFTQCRTPYAVIHGLLLLMMGIMMPETC